MPIVGYDSAQRHSNLCLLATSFIFSECGQLIKDSGFLLVLSQNLLCEPLIQILNSLALQELMCCLAICGSGQGQSIMVLMDAINIYHYNTSRVMRQHGNLMKFTFN